MNTVHVDDVAAAAYALAVWIEKEGRQEANVLAGEEIVACEKSKVKAAEANAIPDAGKKVVAPLFNLVSPFHCHSCVFPSDRGLIRPRHCLGG